MSWLWSCSAVRPHHIRRYAFVLIAVLAVWLSSKRLIFRHWMNGCHWLMMIWIWVFVDQTQVREYARGCWQEDALAVRSWTTIEQIVDFVAVESMHLERNTNIEIQTMNWLWIALCILQECALVGWNVRHVVFCHVFRSLSECHFVTLWTAVTHM